MSQEPRCGTLLPTMGTLLSDMGSQHRGSYSFHFGCCAENRLFVGQGRSRLLTLPRQEIMEPGTRM